MGEASEVKVNVNIDAAAIEAQIMQAILDSAIGKSLTAELTKLAETWKIQSYWDSTLQKTIREIAESVIRQRVADAVGPMVKANVDRFITPDLVAGAVDSAFSRITFKSY